MHANIHTACGTDAHTGCDVTVVIHHASVNEMTGGEAFDSSVAASQT